MTEPVNTPEGTDLPKKEKSEKGASLVEYALLVALIAIVCIVAVRTLGTSISNQFENLGAQIGNG
jgi:pilus assembly protein Flp/PilA